MGLAYGLVAMAVNRSALPGITLYLPPAGWLGNSFILAGVTGLLGLVAAWPASAVLGIALGCGLSALFFIAYAIMRLQGAMNLGAVIVSGIALGLPAGWIAVPIVAAARWGAQWVAEAIANDAPALRMMLVPAFLVAIAAFLGAFEMLGNDATAILKRTDRLMQQGLAATDAASLPEAFRNPAVTHFPVGRSTPYTLEYTGQDLDRFISLRPASNYGEQSAVIARTKEGYTLVCIYPGATRAPSCGDTWQAGRGGGADE
jgi:hypothetical protein